MEQNQKCLKCDALMSFIGNNPIPISLKCNHVVCLNCINIKGDWSPQQPNKECDFECPDDKCKVETKLNLENLN